MQGTTIGYHQVGTINERDLELKPRDCLIWRHGPDVNCEDDKAMCSSWPLAAGFLHNGSAENLRRNTLVGCGLALSDRADVRPFIAMRGLTMHPRRTSLQARPVAERGPISL